MKPKILFFFHLPPPTHGVTLTNARIAQSASIQKELHVKILPISYNEAITGIGQFRPKKILKTISLLAQLTKNLLFFRPTLVYFSIVPTGVSFYRDAIFAGVIKCFRKKILFHLHGTGLDQSIRGPLSAWIYARVFKNSFVIVQSRLLLDDLKKIQKWIRKVFVVPNAIPLANARPREKPAPESVAFINVSTLLPPKGQMDILKAAKKLLDQNYNAFSITLVGQPYDPRYHAELKDFVKKNALENHVVFKGALFGEPKEREIETADVFVFPSHNESFGLVCLEAMRAGLPVITTNVGSLTEIVEPGFGFLYAPGDIEKLAEQMKYFITRKEQIAPMGKKAFEVFRKKFTFDVFEQNLRKVFLDVLRLTPPDASRQPRG